MTNRWLLLSALTVLVIALAIGWLALSRSGRLAYFTLDRRLRIEVNGVPVEGEILDNRASAIVTIRDADKKHSYQLYYSGDVDFTGDMGFVVDCHEWVAPHFPFLLHTRSYPPCTRRFATGVRRWPLILRGHSMQFVTKDHSTISVVMPTLLTGNY
jgi:hypothetical protein